MSMDNQQFISTSATKELDRTKKGNDHFLYFFIACHSQFTHRSCDDPFPQSLIRIDTIDVIAIKKEMQCQWSYKK